MENAFWLGFFVGMITLYIIAYPIFADTRKKQKGKKEPDYWINKPVIHEQHLQSVLLTVTKDVPYEEIKFVNDEWHKRNITDKLKLKMIEEVWKFVKVEMTDDPHFFEKRYTAKLRVLVPTKEALLHEITKKEL